MDVFIKEFEKEFWFKPKRLTFGGGLQQDSYSFKREAPITLFVEARITVHSQFFTEVHSDVLSTPHVGASIRNGTVDVNYLCVAPGLSRIHYTLRVTLAKPTSDTGTTSLRPPIERAANTQILVYRDPDFRGPSQLIEGAVTNVSRLDANIDAIRSFVVVSGNWALFRAPAFQRAYTSTSSRQIARSFGPGHHGDLQSAGLQDGIGSMLGFGP